MSQSKIIHVTSLRRNVLAIVGGQLDHITIVNGSGYDLQYIIPLDNVFNSQIELYIFVSSCMEHIIHNHIAENNIMAETTLFREFLNGTREFLALSFSSHLKEMFPTLPYTMYFLKHLGYVYHLNPIPETQH